MVILIFGASGLLGSTFVPHLERAGHRVLASGRDSAIDIPKDLLARKAVERALDSVHCDVVLNLAAKTDVDACQRDPGSAFEMNTSLPGIAAKACRDRGLRFVHISTDMVYDGPGPHPEEDVRPCNVYASTKARGDLAVQEFGGCAVRTNFFGRSRHATRKSFSDWLLDGFRSGRELTLLNDVLFSPLSMATLSVHLEAILRDPPPGTILNLGSRGGLAKRDFALLLAERCGCPSPSERSVRLRELGLPAPRPLDMRMDVSRFEALHSVSLPRLEDEIQLVAKEYA
jgi:dTDP-4-dehydrorhamnose reductase